MTDLTPESEDTIKALTPSEEMEAWLRERMRRSEAAAIARDREGQKALREALLNALSLIPDRPDDKIARAVRKQARAALATPEAQEADDPGYHKHDFNMADGSCTICGQDKAAWYEQVTR